MMTEPETIQLLTEEYVDYLADMGYTYECITDEYNSVIFKLLDEVELDD